MAKYIEFVGVPGVGKTTTLEFLKKKRNNEKNIVIYEFISTNRNSIRQLVKIKFKFLVNKLVSSNTLYKFNSGEDLLDRFNESNKDLLDLFWKSLPIKKKFKGKDLRFNQVLYISKIIKKIQSIKEEKSNKIYLIDEGLIHSINNFISEDSNVPYEEQIGEVLNKIELPQGVVFIGGDINTIVERVIERPYKREKDKNLAQHELIESRTKSMNEKLKCIELIKLKNIPVLYLDACESLNSKAQKIVSFIKTVEQI